MKKVLFTLFCFLLSTSLRAADFITVWDFTNTNITSFSFQTTVNTGINYTWETIPAGTSGSGITAPGQNVYISGLPPGSKIRLHIDPTNFHSIWNSASASYLVDVEQWGDVVWYTMEHAFTGCIYLNISATDIPNLSQVSNMVDMFRSCHILNGPNNIDNWDLSNVQTIKNMFYGADVFNQPIGSWNTSNMTDMGGAFFYATSFNQPIGNWNTNNVTDMSYMFYAADSFNQPLNNWNIGNVTDLSGMFEWASSFNQPLNNWNTSNVTNMAGMFAMASLFNQTLNNWNTSNVTNMVGMFQHANVFNQPLNNWNTNNVTNMAGMFAMTSLFNQPLDNWITNNVTDMHEMFSYTNAFNQPIGNWNTANVTDMSGMFSYTNVFNQPIGNWNTANVTDMSGMFSYSNVFDQPIGNWNTGNVTDMTEMFSYTSAFNQTIGNWNTSNVFYMNKMFSHASAFNQPIGNWNTSNVNYMTGMFSDASVFNQAIGNWNTGNVMDMKNMFNGAIAFNQPIGSWNTVATHYMNEMFKNATSFNQPLNNWDVSNIQEMNEMFKNATSFNQPLNNWNVSIINEMNSMFYNASSFNQSIGSWNLNACYDIYNMLYGTGLDCSNYSSTLFGWSNNPNTHLSLHLGITNLSLGNNALPYFHDLVNNKFWTFVDSNTVGVCCFNQHLNVKDSACNEYYLGNQILTSSGTYYDTLINSYGCDSSVTLQLTINPFPINIQQNGPILTALIAGTNYQWVSCPSYTPILGATSQSYVAQVNGSYAVIATNSVCTDTSECKTVIGIGIEEHENSQGPGFVIYPNPTSGKLYIKGTMILAESRKELYNAVGQLVLTTNQNEINTDKLASGVYYIRCEQYLRKVVVE